MASIQPMQSNSNSQKITFGAKPFMNVKVINGKTGELVPAFVTRFYTKTDATDLAIIKDLWMMQNANYVDIIINKSDSIYGVELADRSLPVEKRVLALASTHYVGRDRRFYVDYMETAPSSKSSDPASEKRYYDRDFLGAGANLLSALARLVSKIPNPYIELISRSDSFYLSQEMRPSGKLMVLAGEDLGANLRMVEKKYKLDPKNMFIHKNRPEKQPN